MVTFVSLSKFCFIACFVRNSSPPLSEWNLSWKRLMTWPRMCWLTSVLVKWLRSLFAAISTLWLNAIHSKFRGRFLSFLKQLRRDCFCQLLRSCSKKNVQMPIKRAVDDLSGRSYWFGLCHSLLFVCLSSASMNLDWQMWCQVLWDNWNVFPLSCRG